MDGPLIRAAFGFYVLATGLALAYLRSRDQKLTLWMWHLLGFGLAAHTASLGLRLAAFWASPGNRFFLPLNSYFGTLSLLALLNGLVFFGIEGAARLHILGAFVLPWTLFACGAALLADPALPELPPELMSYSLHPLALLLSYAALANAFGIGLALLVQERQVKSRCPDELCYRLPSIAELDRLHWRVTATGFLALSAGLASGALWARRAWSGGWTADAKVVAALLTWSLYAAALAGRRSGLRGPRGVRLAMAGFLCLLATLVGASALTRLHSYLTR